MTQLYILNLKKNSIKKSHSEYCLNLHSKQKKELRIKNDLDEYQKFEEYLTSFN